MSGVAKPAVTPLFTVMVRVAPKVTVLAVAAPKLVAFKVPLAAKVMPEPVAPKAASFVIMILPVPLTVRPPRNVFVPSK